MSHFRGWEEYSIRGFFVVDGRPFTCEWNDYEAAGKRQFSSNIIWVHNDAHFSKAYHYFRSIWPLLDLFIHCLEFCIIYNSSIWRERYYSMKLSSFYLTDSCCRLTWIIVLIMPCLLHCLKHWHAHTRTHTLTQDADFTLFYTCTYLLQDDCCCQKAVFCCTTVISILHTICIT